MKDDGRTLPESIEDLSEDDLRIVAQRLEKLMAGVPQITPEQYEAVKRAVSLAG